MHGIDNTGTPKYKVLILVNRLVLSGWAIDIIPMAHLLCKSEFCVHVLYGENEKSEIDASFFFDKYPVTYRQKIKPLARSINFIKDIRSFVLVYKYIQRFKPDIIHTHGAKIGIIGRIAARLARVKVVVHTFHGNLFHKYYNAGISGAIRILERGLAKITTCVIALSANQWHELVKVFKIAPAEKTKIIPLGIDIPHYLENSERKRLDFRKKYLLPSEMIAVGFIGRISAVKNPLFFANVIAKVIESGNNNICFFWIGDGELKVQVQKLLSNYSIKWSENSEGFSRVIFTSWVKDVTTVIHGLDVVSLTSVNEGTPLCLIEAQLCGKPVIASNVGGVADIMMDTETGFLINSMDVESFAEKIILLEKSDSLRTAMGEKACEFAIQQFSKDRETQQLIELFKSYLRLGVA